jgi:uncharacterized protein YdeI (YjbR/CyaY-like superfamily)
VIFESASAWEAWLESNWSSSDGVWLQFAKKGSGVVTVTHDEALEVALCFGWIDGQTRRCEEDPRYFLQRWTPRRARSIWSQVNRAKAEALIAAGQMREGGLREVERARADGRWDAAYEPASRATVPEDLQAFLDSDPAAAEFFAGLSAQNRYSILHRLATARRPETRARRLEKFCDMLRRGESIYP